jgi:hypothetical protein
MRWQTFWRLSLKHEELVSQWMQAIAEKFGQSGRR